MRNPLDNPGQIFDLELMNPNPTAGKNKQGSWYRVSFELTQEDHQMFMDADTPGLLIAAKACVVAHAEGELLEKKTEKKPKGPYSEQAKSLWLSSFFRNPKIWQAIGTDQQYLDWLKNQKCSIDDKKYGPHEGDVVPMHVRRVKAGDDITGAGTGIKPQYSAIPGCNHHHDMQHNDGESAVGGKEMYDRLRIKYLQRWAWERLTALMGVESMAQVKPIKVFEWAKDHQIERYLPFEYSLAAFDQAGS